MALIGQNGTHDQITEEIGSGGMGVVYEADGCSAEERYLVVTQFGEAPSSNPYFTRARFLYSAHEVQ